jgi:hypothetical protein
MSRLSALPALPALLLAFTLAGSLGASPAAQAGPDLAPLAEPDPAQQGFGVPATAQALLGLADRAGGTLGAGDTLATLGVLPATGPGPRSPDLASALARLGPQAAADGAFAAALDPATAAALVPVVDAVADADGLLDAAFAALSEEERARLVAGVLDLDLPGERTLAEQQRAAELEALAGLVDPAPLHEAAARLLAAAEGFLAAAPSLPAANAPAPPGPAFAKDLLAPTVGVAGHPDVCGFGGGFSLVSLGGLVEVGFTGGNSYVTERVLIVDLGGDDCYENHPAAVGPGANLALPVSVILDVGGNDIYYSGDAHHTGPPGTTWSAGVGIGGVGLLADRWGDDTYYTVLNNEPSNCLTYGGSSTWQRLYTQGVGILGAGALVDLGGNDRYAAYNYNTFPDPFCHWGRVYTYAQGLGARLGVGALVDDTGNDGYYADSYAEGKYDNNAHTHAQGVAASRGVGALVDKEGNDRYFANAEARLSFALANIRKGMFAYTFAQASLYGANEPRNEGVSLGVSCKELVQDPLCERFEQAIEISAGVDPCAQAGAIGVGQPVLDQALAALKNAVPGVAAPVAVPCDHPAYAVLVDLLGQDDYFARAGSNDNGLGCDWGAWAGVSAQGSAPAKGIAALVDAALDTPNQFRILTDAEARGCWTLGVRSYTAGQGFGGAFMWDYWDRPPFDPLLITDLSVGLLVRGGMCGLGLDLSKPVVNLRLDLDDPCPDAWAGDAYDATARSYNGAVGPVTQARTYAQGSGNGKLTANEVPGGPYDALGVGGLVDLFGDDVHSATAYALNPAAPGPQEPRVVAQGAGASAIGVLVNVGDVDSYYANAFWGAAAAPVPVAPWQSLPWILAQADATVETPVSFQFCVLIVCNKTDILFGGGVLVDLFGGFNDSYSQAFPWYCANNGFMPLSPWIWGTVLPGACLVHNPMMPPPPDSQGFILGVDW